MTLDEPFRSVLDRLNRQGMDVAANHFLQAQSAFDRRQFESCNAQVRSALESLFDVVAALRIGSTKTGGLARKELVDHGVLNARESEFIKAFMDLAGSAGSHAGNSNENDCLGRTLAGLGVAQIALGLCPELVLVEHVLSESLVAPPGTKLPTDSKISTTCPTCRNEQTLSEADVKRTDAGTAYHCKNGCQVLVVVGTPETESWAGRGYRLGPHVIRNAADIFLSLEGASKRVKFDASTAALMLKRPDGS